MKSSFQTFMYLYHTSVRAFTILGKLKKKLLKMVSEFITAAVVKV